MPGAFRSGRDVLAVRGPDAEAYLQGQLSQDVAALAVGDDGGLACCWSPTASCRRWCG